MKLQGYINWLKSESTNNEFPLFVASADVDFVTDGLLSVSSIVEPLIVVGQATDEEYNSDYSNGLLLFQNRANTYLNRNDLKAVLIVKMSGQHQKAKGISFQEYRNSKNEIEIIYSDPYQLNSISKLVRQESVEDFISRDGKIIKILI